MESYESFYQIFEHRGNLQDLQHSSGNMSFT